MNDHTPADDPDNRIRFQLKLSPDLHHRVKLAAVTRGETMNDLITRAVEHDLQLEAAQRQEVR